MNINLILHRNSKYLDITARIDGVAIEGGLHDKAEAIALRDKLKEFLDELNYEIERLP